MKLKRMLIETGALIAIVFIVIYYFAMGSLFFVVGFENSSLVLALDLMILNGLLPMVSLCYMIYHLVLKESTK